jgi:hypothetical protein
MALKKKLFTPWSSLDNMLGKLPSWWPEEEQQRIASYEKYDQMYWNDPTQYAIRVLDNEQPIYVPNARVVVDTTAQWLMKGLQIVPVSSTGAPDVNDDTDIDQLPPPHQMLEGLLRRERFRSRYAANKKAGITRGDSAFHITADPNALPGARISIETLHPGMVWKVPDPDDPSETIRIHIVEQWIDPGDDQQRVRIRKLTYEKVIVGGSQRIQREEAIYELQGDKGFWYGPTPQKVKQILPQELLPASITHFPVYWFNNLEWESQDYGSSDLRGLEYLDWASSQGATDTQSALSLHGLGVYATDGGRPVNDRGEEVDWEIVPGGVAEVPSGAYFRRVEGISSIQPMMDQLKYLEGKMYSAAGLTDVALGQVDVKVAQSGIALAIKFMPTLARIEDRDTAHTEILQQMWFDLRSWFETYDSEFQIPEVDVVIAKTKLPPDRVTTLNELNNMIDRKIISRATYRKRVADLGYIIDDNAEEKQLLKEAKTTAKLNKLTTPIAPGTSAGDTTQANGQGGTNSTVDNAGNQSNNQSRTNESSGTEAGQPAAAQAKP